MGSNSPAQVLGDVLSLWQGLVQDLRTSGLLTEAQFTWQLHQEAGNAEVVTRHKDSWTTLLQCLQALKHQLNNKKPTEAGSKQPLVCNVCLRTFSTFGRLQRHLALHQSSDGSKKKAFACKIKACRRQFASQDLLDHHKEKVHQDKSAQKPVIESEDGEDLGNSRHEQGLPFYCCEKCNKCFRSREDALRPKNHPVCVSEKSKEVDIIDQVHLLEAHNRFACGYCDEEYRQLFRMEYHLSKCNGGPFLCELCNASFQLRRELNTHKSDLHAHEMPFRCSECPRKFQRNNSLQKHLVRQHEKKVSSHPCDKCGKRFVKKVYLTNHQTRFHNLFKAFLCHTCGDRFTSAASLSSHQEIHAGVRRFSCSECEKTFRRRDKLNFHIQAVHTGERPHVCQICSKGFVRKSKLQDHIRRHTGEKRFSCLVCNKMFSGSSDLRHHLQRHHPSGATASASTGSVGINTAKEPIVAVADVQQGALATVPASMKLEASLGPQDLLEDALQINMDELQEACQVSIPTLEYDDSTNFINHSDLQI